jgi:ribonucleoside-diphosphate reductase beta chain
VSVISYAAVNPLDLIGSKKIGLLESTGTYDITRYPWAYEAWKRQQQIHWVGEEVPLGEDVKDWNQDKLKPEERHFLTQLFRFFTQSDVEVADNYFKRYIPIFQPLEIQMMMAAFTNMETVHIDAYALLLKTLGMSQSEFEAFKEYDAMRRKADYMHGFGTQTCADVARTLAMFGAFTEGMALFASFAMLMNFPRHNKMKGMGQIVSWSVRDESLHCESMIRLFHCWTEETQCLSAGVRNDIQAVGETMVNLEDKFIELAFELGDIEGLRMSEIKNYIRYICDWRMVQLKLEPMYGYFAAKKDNYQQLQEHPLSWLSSMLNGVEHANFFETRATEYSKASTRGQWEGVDGAWQKFESFTTNTECA